MTRTNRPSPRMLLLVLLIIAPLQAQAVFACSMMEMLFHGDCCCEVYCVDAISDTGLESRSGSCCEISVELSFDREVPSDIPVLKVEIRSDVDPPPPIVALQMSALYPLSAGAPYPLVVFVNQSGSTTYLTTRRLRI